MADRYPRLHFGDGGTLDLVTSIPDLLQADYEARWRTHHVRVEWLMTPRGRLDHLLRCDVLRKSSASRGRFRA